HSIRDAGATPTVDLKVRPWGRIEGALRIGHRPGIGETLNLAYERQGDTNAAIPHWGGTARTADEGRFVFERVIPGEVTISREILLKQSASSRTVGNSHTVGVDVAPGATARLTMGGTGRPVAGKVILPNGSAGPIDWTYSNNSLIPKPTMFQKLFGFGARKGTSVPRGVGYTIKLEADGSFRVEDVEPGTYDLLIVVNQPPRDPFGIGLGTNVLATAHRELVVPPMPGGRSDEPLDVGAIPVVAIKQP
ncbi:MAG TPA: hypothetical protein VKA66_23025, partial [Mycobacterium sp.]|nr:hypothetical protein [Mycobacterium sp.]